MNRLWNKILAHPGMTTSFVVVLFAVCVISLTKIQKESGVTSLLSSENPLVVLKSDMSRVFGNPNVAFVAIPPRERVQEELDDLRKLKELVTDLESSEDVESVVSVFSAKTVVESDDGFQIEGLLQKAPQNEEQLQGFHRRIEALPSFKGQIVGLNNNAYAIIVEFKDGLEDQFAKQKFLDLFKKYEIHDWAMSGLPIINAWVLELIDADQAFLVPAFFFCLIFILYAAFGTIRGVLIPFANMIYTIVMTLALMATFGVSLNVVTDVLPLLLAALASAYSVHYMNQYYEERRADPSSSRNDIITKTNQNIFPTIAMAGITTVFGFLASVTSGIPAVREFSLFASFGVLSILFSVGIITPLILRLVKLEKSLPDTNRFNAALETIIEKFSSWAQLKTKGIVIFAFFVGLAGLAGTFFVQSKYSALDYFRSRATVVEDARMVSKNFGGFSSFNIVIKSSEKNKKSPLNIEVLKQLEGFSQKVVREHSEDVKVTMSVAESAKELRKTYNGGQEFYGIPKSDEELAQYLEVYDWSSSFADDFKNFISSDYQLIRLTGKFSVREFEDGTFAERPVQFHDQLVEGWVKEIQEKLPAGFTAMQYGDIPMWSHIVDEVIEGQIKSIIIAVFVIFLVTALSLRSLIVGAICMVPVTLAILVNFGFMALFDIQLDIATSLISGMALGIGIDDTIHFTLTLRRKFHEVGDMNIAVTETLKSSGRAIIYTSIALTAGFCTYFASGFKPIIHFGLLNAVTLVTTTFAALVVLPAVFLLTDGNALKGKQHAS